MTYKLLLLVPGNYNSDVDNMLTFFKKDMCNTDIELIISYYEMNYWYDKYSEIFVKEKKEHDICIIISKFASVYTIPKIKNILKIFGILKNNNLEKDVYLICSGWNQTPSKYNPVKIMDTININGKTTSLPYCLDETIGYLKKFRDDTSMKNLLKNYIKNNKDKYETVYDIKKENNEYNIGYDEYYINNYLLKYMSENKKPYCYVDSFSLINMYYYYHPLVINKKLIKMEYEEYKQIFDDYMEIAELKNFSYNEIINAAYVKIKNSDDKNSSNMSTQIMNYVGKKIYKLVKFLKYNNDNRIYPKYLLDKVISLKKKSFYSKVAIIFVNLNVSEIIVESLILNDNKYKIAIVDEKKYLMSKLPYPLFYLNDGENAYFKLVDNGIMINSHDKSLIRPNFKIDFLKSKTNNKFNKYDKLILSTKILMTNIQPLRDYSRNNPRTDIHFGQKKLFLSELFFLTKYGHLSDLVLYAGAAPGTHIPYLMKLFPYHHFILVDPAPFKLKYPPNYKSSIEKRLVTINSYFTDDLAMEFIKFIMDNDKYKNKKLLFISDIRSGSDSERVQGVWEKNIIENNEMQNNWIKILNPIKSLLKFRTPFKEGYTKCYYGDIYLQPFANYDSAETRLICGPDYNMSLYDNFKHERQMVYHNLNIRNQKIINPLYKKNSRKNNKKINDKYINWDHSAEILIIYDYLRMCKTKKNISKKISKIIRNINYYCRLSQKQL